LPAVFGLMALASMLPVFELLAGRVDKLNQPWYDVKGAWLVQLGNATSAQNTSDVGFWDEVEITAFWKYENCFYVGDLFEAWTLFQFGKLILEEIGESIAKHGHRSPEITNDSDQEQEAQQSQLEDQEPHALSQLEADLVDSHRAVKALTWVGTSMFVLLCVEQSAVSLWPYLVTTAYDADTLMFTLSVGGFVTSCAAIYNLVIVESAFHRHLEPISPVLKFVTVKLLVSLSFFQSSVLAILQAAEKTLPDTTRSFLRYVPLLGDILSMSDVQSHLFYPALTIFECLFLTFLHLFIWKADEAWYVEAEAASEKTPLLKDV